LPRIKNIFKERIMARTSASSRALTDHNEVRRWAEERGAHPACVRGTGDNNDVGMIRLDFPGYSGEGKLEEIFWDEWFDKFDESGLALLVQDETAGGQRSNFNKLVSRETAGLYGGGRSKSSRNQKPSRRSSEQNGGRETAAGYSEDEFESEGDDMEDGVELEEVDVEIERARPARRSAAHNSGGRKRQSGAKRATTSPGSRSSSSVRGTSSQRGRSNQKTRGTSSKKGRTTGGARSKAKKAPTRATSSTSRTTRRVSGGRKRAA
jgi:hypothetical protein